MGKAILIVPVFLLDNIGHIFISFILGLIKPQFVFQPDILTALLNKFLFYFLDHLLPILYLPPHMRLVVLVKGYLLFQLHYL